MRDRLYDMRQMFFDLPLGNLEHRGKLLSRHPPAGQ